MFSVCDFGDEFGEEDAGAPEELPVDAYPDGLVSSYFDRENDNAVVDLGSVFLALEEKESQFSEPPNEFDLLQLLKNQKVQSH